jgi:PAS domain S-box-containing protein
MATRPQSAARKRPDRTPVPRDRPASAGGHDFHAILESLPGAVYALDLDGCFTYLNPRACELFGYEPGEGAQFIGRSIMDVLSPGGESSVADAIRHRVEFPLDLQTFRVAGKHKNGQMIPCEVQGGPLWRDGQIVGRVGVCRLLPESPDDDGEARHRTGANALHQDRLRIARGLRDAIAQIVFGVTPDRDASESFLADVTRATRVDLARRLNLDDVDLDILRLVARGSSNREIGPEVHLSAAAVKDRIRRLMTRLGARRRAELAAQALRLGIA